MNKMVLEIPLVSQCEVIDCTYNVGSNCHARAITVGDGVNPECDTFFKEPNHIRNALQIAGIGACKVAGCRYNDDFECMTASIRVGLIRNQATCMTYAAR